MVTAAALNRLARLAEADPGAAHEQLERLAEAHPVRVSQLLSLTPAELARCGEHLVVQVRTARKRRAAEKEARRSSKMVREVAALEATAAIRPGEIVLDPSAFSAVARVRAKGALLFDSPLCRGAVDLRLLRRLIRECRSADLRAVALREAQLHIGYRTAAGRGRFRLKLNPPENGAPVYPVNLHPKPAPTSQQLGGVWRHLFDAVGAAA